MKNISSSSKRHILSVFVLSAVSLAIYANALWNGFVYDDRYSIVYNDFIKDIRNISGLFDRGYFQLSEESSYRPVVTLTHFIEYQLYGLNPWGYHLTNIIIHTINGILLYLFILQLYKKMDVENKRQDVLPLFVSLLFISHPIMTEAVNAVSFREDLLVFGFYSATLVLYFYSKESLSNNKTSPAVALYSLSCLAYAAALLSKEMAVTLPLIVLCYETVYHKKNTSSIFFNVQNLGYIVITMAYLYLRFYLFHNPMERKLVSYETVGSLFTTPATIFNYLKLTLFPISLSASYVSTPVRPLFSFLHYFIGAAFLVALIVLSWRRGKGIIFGTIFFIVTLMPVYHLVPAERFLYLPVGGLCIVIGLLINRLFIYRKEAQLLMYSIVVIYSTAVISRNMVWKDDYSLWTDAIRKVPSNGRPYNDIGNVYLERGQYDEAIKLYQTAIKLKPDFLEAQNNLGMAYAKLGKFNDAVVELRNALKLDPTNLTVHSTLADAYAKQWKNREAIEEYRIIIKIRPNDPQYHYILGSLYDREGELGKAVDELRIAARLNPRFIDAYYYLGIIYLKKGLKVEARKEFEEILKLKPDYLLVRQLIESLDREKK